MARSLKLLTAELLSDQLINNISTDKVRQEGAADYTAGYAKVGNVLANVANLTVQDRRTKHSMAVTISLYGNGVSLTCTCGRGYGYRACRHQVAAFLELRDHLTKHPPSIWRNVLDSLPPTTKRAKPTQANQVTDGVLMFSFTHNSGVWSITPYTMLEELLPEDLRQDPVALSKYINKNKIYERAIPITGHITHERFPKASDAEIVAARLTVVRLTQYYNQIYFSSTNNHANALAALPYLTNSLVFSSTYNNPLQRPIAVLSDAGSFENTLQDDGQTLSITTQLRIGEKVLPVKPNQYLVLASDPLWIKLGDIILPVEGDQPPEVLLEYQDLEIPNKDRDEFLDMYLPKLAERLPIRSEKIETFASDTPPTARVYLSEAQAEIQAELRFAYGDYEVNYDRRLPQTTIQRVEDREAVVRIQRQPEVEEARWQQLSTHGLKRGNDQQTLVLRKNVTPLDFLLQQVPKLIQSDYTIYGEEQLTSARINRNKPSIWFKVNSGIDWFDLQGGVQFGDQNVPLSAVRQALKRREKYVKLADGTLGPLPEEWLNQYRKLLGLGKETDDDQLRFDKNQVTLIDQLLGAADRAQADTKFQDRLKQLQSFDGIHSHPLPPNFQGELRPYQKAGYDWLHFLHQYGFGGCLADDMGTGKTIQTLAFLESIYHEDNDRPATLIVMPRSLLFNWQREAEKFAPQLGVYIHADSGRITKPEEFGEHELVLTTYGTMLKDINLLKQYQFYYAVLDESQAIKNPLAETSKAARMLNASHRLVLTGTPVENSTIELWSQFAFLNPGLLGSMDYFRNEFTNPIERNRDVDTAQFLRKMVFPFILRRTKEQVASDLPPRTERVVICDMEPAQRKAYDRQRQIYRAKLLNLIETSGMDNARMQILEGLLRLRQICNHPRLVDEKYKGSSGKLEFLFDHLDTLRAEGHRALIFSQFVQMLSIIRGELDQREIPYAYLDGQTRDRQEQVDRFQNSNDLPFFLISLKAGGVGLNLTAADYVIHVDPWWNPAVELQATDRTHRIGQDKPVFVYRLVTRESVEEKILQLQEAKRNLIDQLIDTDASVFKSLNSDDIQVLFS
jgi:non-specific serine/threonine protein kinase